MPAPRPCGRALRSSAVTPSGISHDGTAAVGVEQLGELGAGELASLGTRRDQAKRPPDLARGVVRPLGLGKHLHPELGCRVRAPPRVGQQVCAHHARRRSPPARRVPRRGSPRGQRYGDDERAVRQLPCRREHRRTRASGLVTTAAGPDTSGSSRIRAFSWPARCLSWPMCRCPSGRLVASASTGQPASSARTSAGARRSARNGPCSGARSAVTGPASRSIGPGCSDDPRGTRSEISTTASGDPSASCSTKWSASAGTALAGTVRVTGTGHGVPSASSPRAATAVRSAVVR